jgi:hypothetical protein
MPDVGTSALGFEFEPDMSRNEPNYILQEMTIDGCIAGTEDSSWDLPLDSFALDKFANLTMYLEKGVCTVAINGVLATGIDVMSETLVSNGTFVFQKQSQMITDITYSIGSMHMKQPQHSINYLNFVTTTISYMKVEEGVRSNVLESLFNTNTNRTQPYRTQPSANIFVNDMTSLGKSDSIDQSFLCGEEVAEVCAEIKYGNSVRDGTGDGPYMCSGASDMGMTGGTKDCRRKCSQKPGCNAWSDRWSGAGGGCAFSKVDTSSSGYCSSMKYRRGFSGVRVTECNCAEGLSKVSVDKCRMACNTAELIEQAHVDQFPWTFKTGKDGFMGKMGKREPLFAASGSGGNWDVDSSRDYASLNGKTEAECEQLCMEMPECLGSSWGVLGDHANRCVLSTEKVVLEDRGPEPQGKVTKTGISDTKICQ